MLPLSEDRALELWDAELPIFRLYKDGTEGLLETKEEIFSHDGLFGVERKTWREYLKSQNHTKQNEMLNETTMVM